MMKARMLLAVPSLLLAAAAPVLAQQLAPTPPVRPEPPPAFKLIDPGPAVPDWLGYNYDAQRSGWNRGGTALSAATVGRLRPLGNTKLTGKAVPLVLSTLP